MWTYRTVTGIIQDQGSGSHQEGGCGIGGVTRLPVTKASKGTLLLVVLTEYAKFCLSSLVLQHTDSGP